MRRRARGRVVTGRQSVLVVMVLLGPATAAEVGERPADYRRVAQQAEVAAAASTAVPSAGRGTPARVVPDHGGRSGRGHLVLVRGLLLVVLGGESGQNRVTVVGVLLLLLLLLGKVVVLVVGRASSSGQVAEAHIHIGKQRSAFKIKRQIRCITATSNTLAYYGFCSSLTNLKPSCQSAAL